MGFGVPSNDKGSGMQKDQEISFESLFPAWFCPDRFHMVRFPGSLGILGGDWFSRVHERAASLAKQVPQRIVDDTSPYPGIGKLRFRLECTQ
jgi:hypothetical protein